MTQSDRSTDRHTVMSFNQQVDGLTERLMDVQTRDREQL
jgi:hypothetical protein